MLQSYKMSFSVAQWFIVDWGLLILEVLQTLDTTHLVALIWTSDLPDAETS